MLEHVQACFGFLVQNMPKHVLGCLFGEQKQVETDCLKHVLYFQTGSPEHVPEQSKTGVVEQVKTGSPEHVLGFGCFDLFENSRTCSNRGGQFADVKVKGNQQNIAGTALEEVQTIIISIDFI